MNLRRRSPSSLWYADTLKEQIELPSKEERVFKVIDLSTKWIIYLMILYGRGGNEQQTKEGGGGTN